MPAAVYDVKAGPEVGGAILTANARDSSMAAYGEATSFFACLMPYQGGYSLNVYTTFSKASGSFNAATLAATLARPLVGDTSQFIPRTAQPDRGRGAANGRDGDAARSVPLTANVPVPIKGDAC